MEIANVKLKAARKELLDLGLRNPLLNFRTLRARGVEVVGERPFHLYHHLVTNEQPMGFLSTAVFANDNDSLKQPESQPAINPHHIDDQLQTPYSDTELQKRLLTTYFVAREYIEEQGVNVLYLALGMLRWVERDGGKIRRAPLLLIPVELIRPHIAGRFRLRYTGADWSDNLPLRTKLSLDFNIELPPMPSGDRLNVRTFFAKVAEAVRSMQGWLVENTAVSLGFFSFSKYLMYHDLDAANWPASRLPTAHPVIRALLTEDGFSRFKGQLADDAPIDSHIKLEQSHQVVDADSSQTLAILDVNAGHDLVIQGPPGTGKSQTISNLIAEAVGQGKTVLFVAEKMAALDVVQRRLDGIGLGDICLELHSHKTTKRTVAAELGRTLRLGQPKSDGRFSNLATLKATRDYLNQQSHAINTPIGSSETTLYEAYGHLLQLRAQFTELDLPTLIIPQLNSWSAAEFDQRLAAANDLQQCLGKTAVPIQHPLWGTQHLSVSEELPSQISRLADVAQDGLNKLKTAAGKLAELLKTATPPNFTDLTKLVFAAQQLQIAPKLYGIQTEHQAWKSDSEGLLDALKAGAQISEALLTYDDWLIPEAWAQDVLSIRHGLMVGRSWWKRPFSRKYRHAKEQLAGLCRIALPERWEDEVGAVDAILDVQRGRPLLDSQEPLLQQIFGLRWLGLDSDFADLLQIGEWIHSMNEGVRQELYPATLLKVAAAGADIRLLEASCQGIAEARRGYELTLSALHEQLQFDPARRFGADQPFISLPIAEQEKWLLNAHAAAETIVGMVAYNRQVRETAVLGLTLLVEIAHHWPHAANHLTDLLQHARYTALVERAHANRPALQGFRQQHPDETVAQFIDLDSQFLIHNRIRLANEHWQRLPRYEAGGQMGLLHSEIGKKRNHMPIRQLMQQAGNVIQRIKPLFMMSPLSIATYLPPESVRFDLVIFDEASQVRPVDAFGAILRGRQVVVVGDNRQLPPTTFFERLIGEDDQAALIGQESILDLFLAQNGAERMLRWHYRSRHESLITVSNQEFYDRKLVVFPSPDAEKQDMGLRYHYLPYTAYQRGGSRTNPQEADAVAAAVMRHAEAQPHLTLGVVAFSRSQRRAIRQRLERLRRENPALEPFFRAHLAEPFFVKNLENVQGDERDVILISVGYGRSADGTLTMNFGPLNQDGGERRLNVLITRARRRCEIFTNLTADDINLRRTDARGVVALKRYLQFAQSGEMGDLPPETMSIPAKFEDVLADDLRSAGYKVAQRVGMGPVRVDVAIMGEADHYIFGIECDGDNYHLARSARDRDRIQAQVLARLGWSVHRVWSQQWWQNWDEERENLLTAIKSATAGTQRFAENHRMRMVVPSDHRRKRGERLQRYDSRPTITEPRPIPLYSRSTVTIDLGTRSFYHMFMGKNRTERKENRRQLLEWGVQIVDDEGPIHVEELRRQMSHAAGYQVMSMPPELTDWVAKEGTKKERIRMKDEFLWPVGMKWPLPRDRSQLPNVSRKFSYISSEEIEEAVRLVVADAFSIPPEDVPLRTGRLFGFRQIGGKSKAAVLAAIERLVGNGRLVQRRGQLENYEL